ncbi:MAG: hypothetical protein KatS3mg035_0105 [Bacteroidia bacterium]|nr:MAG: hypothetical protein KatS3mg035_0105 [Bacteroidia bacterium]
MIILKSEQSLTKFVQVCTQFFKSYTQTIPHFFQNAEVFLTPNLKFDENNIADSLKTLFINYRDNGYWFLFEDKFLGKISIHHPFFSIYQRKMGTSKNIINP